MDINKEYYLIIGEISDIGYAVAEKLHEAGANAVIVGTNETELNHISKQFPDIKTISADLSDSVNVGHFFDEIAKENIRLCGMVYISGLPQFMNPDNPIDLMERSFAVNLFSFIEACKYYYMPKFGKDESGIVAVLSGIDQSSDYGKVLYETAKDAMNSAVKLMAKELFNRELIINSLRLGTADSEILGDAANQIMHMLSHDFKATGSELIFNTMHELS